MNLTTAILGGRGGEKASGWCFGALPVTWLGEEVGDEVQELGSTSGRRGGGGGREGARRWRRLRSVRAREREQRRGVARARAASATSCFIVSRSPSTQSRAWRRLEAPSPLPYSLHSLSLLCSLPTTPPNTPIAAVRRCRDHRRPDNAPSCSRAPAPRRQPPHRAMRLEDPRSAVPDPFFLLGSPEIVAADSSSTRPPRAS